MPVDLLDAEPRHGGQGVVLVDDQLRPVRAGDVGRQPRRHGLVKERRDGSGSLVDRAEGNSEHQHALGRVDDPAGLEERRAEQHDAAEQLLSANHLRHQLVTSHAVLHGQDGNAVEVGVELSRGRRHALGLHSQQRQVGLEVELFRGGDANPYLAERTVNAEAVFVDRFGM
jgi:hypothetical protein